MSLKAFGSLRVFREEPTVRVGVVFFVVLLTARLMGAYFQYFWEEDELSLAAGTAALVRDSIGGGLYRYAPQLGYYRFIEGVDLLLGGRVGLIPFIMKAVSALSGALIPLAALFTFRRALTVQERWLMAAVLTVNPIVWTSAQYGNSGMLQAAMIAVAVAILSNRPRVGAETLSLVLFGLAVVARADAILVAPVVAYLIWVNHPGRRGAAIARAVLVSMAVAVPYALALAFDPRSDNMGTEIALHIFNSWYPTMFWEYLIWAISPIPLLVAFVGFRQLLAERREVWGFVLAWCTVPILFYYGSTTTPRYFLLTAVPIALCTAVGVTDLARVTARIVRPSLAWATVLLLVNVHLFVGLGRFTPDNVLNPFIGPTLRTHDGFMPTGALLYWTYNPSGKLLGNLGLRGFGEGSFYGEGFPALFTDLRSGAREGRTAVILLDGGFAHGFHYYAQLEQATYVSRVPGLYFETETWLELDGMRIMTISREAPQWEGLERLELQSGDLIYRMRGDPFPDAVTVEKLPPGLELELLTSSPPLAAVRDFNGRPFAERYVVVSQTGGG
jgi:hypothetical protein